MAITFVNVGTVATATSGDVIPGLPSDWAADDIHICIISSYDNIHNSMPAGWFTWVNNTHSGTTCNFSVYWRRAVAGDGNPTVTHTLGSYISAAIVGYRGCSKGATPADGTRSSFSASSTKITFGSVTSNTNNTMGLEIGCSRLQRTCSTYTGDPTPTERLDQPNTANYPEIILADFPLITRGTDTGTRSATLSSTSVNQGMLVLLRAAPIIADETNTLLGLNSCRNPREFFKLNPILGLISTCKKSIANPAIKLLLGLKHTLTQTITRNRFLTLLVGLLPSETKSIAIAVKSFTKNIGIITSSVRTYFAKRMNSSLLGIKSLHSRVSGKGFVYSALLGLKSITSKLSRLNYTFFTLNGLLSKYAKSTATTISLKLGILSTDLHNVFYTVMQVTRLGLKIIQRRVASLWREFMYCLQFGGSGYVIVNSSASLQPTTNISMEAWVYKDAFVDAGGICRKKYNWSIQNAWSGAPGYDANKFEFQVVAGGNDVHITTTNTYDILRWWHLLATYDGVHVNIYVNGILDRTYDLTGAINTSDDALNIGQDTYNNYFNGRIDEVRIYSRTLSATEVLQHSQGLFLNESNLAALWHFSEGVGNTTVDSSGNNNTGSFIGSVSWNSHGVRGASVGTSSITSRIVSFMTRSFSKNIGIITSSLRTFVLVKVLLPLLGLLSKRTKIIGRILQVTLGLLIKYSKGVGSKINSLLGLRSRRNPKGFFKIISKLGEISIISKTLTFNRTLASLLGLSSVIRKSMQDVEEFISSIGLKSTNLRIVTYSLRSISKNLGIITVSIRTFASIRILNLSFELVSKRIVSLSRILQSSLSLLVNYSKGFGSRIRSSLELLSRRNPRDLFKIFLEIGEISTDSRKVFYNRILTVLLGLRSVVIKSIHDFELFLASIGFVSSITRVSTYSLRSTSKNISIITLSTRNVFFIRVQKPLTGLLSKITRGVRKGVSVLLGLLSKRIKYLSTTVKVLLGFLSKRVPDTFSKIVVKIGLLANDSRIVFFNRIIKSLFGLSVTVRKSMRDVEEFIAFFGYAVVNSRVVTYSIRAFSKNIGVITSSIKTVFFGRILTSLAGLLSVRVKKLSRILSISLGLFSVRVKMVGHEVNTLLGLLSRRNPKEILKLKPKIGLLSINLKQLFITRILKPLSGILVIINKKFSIIKILVSLSGVSIVCTRIVTYSLRSTVKNIGIITSSLRILSIHKLYNTLFGLLSKRRTGIQKILFSLIGFVAKYSKGMSYRVKSLLELFSKRIPDTLEKIKITVGLLTTVLPKLTFKRVFKSLVGLQSFFGSHADDIEVFIASLGVLVVNRRIVSYALRATTKNIKIITFNFVNRVSRRYLTSIIGLVSFKYRAKSYSFNLFLGLKNVFSRTLLYSLRSFSRNIGIKTISTATRTIVLLFNSLLGLTSRNTKRIRTKIVVNVGLISLTLRQGFYRRLNIARLGLLISFSRISMITKVFVSKIGLVSRYIHGSIRIFTGILGIKVQRFNLLSITKRMQLGLISIRIKSISKIRKVSVGIKSFRFNQLRYTFIILIGVKIPNILHKSVMKLLKGFSGLLGIIYFPFKSKTLISTLGISVLKLNVFSRILKVTEGFIVLRYKFLSRKIKSFIEILSRRNIHFSRILEVFLGLITLNSRLLNKILKGLLVLQSNIYRSISRRIIISFAEFAEYSLVYAHGYEYLIKSTLGLLTVFNYKILVKIFRASVGLFSTKSRRFTISIIIVTFNGLKSFTFKSTGFIRLFISRLSFSKYFSRVLHNPLLTMKFLTEHTLEFEEEITSLKYVDRKYEIKFYTDSTIHNILL
jgi:hypothetical protein